MAKKKKPVKKLKGAARMVQLGHKRVEVWLDPNEYAVLERARALVRRPLATFIREAAFGSAGVVLDAERANLSPNSGFWHRMLNKQLPGTVLDHG